MAAAECVGEHGARIERVLPGADVVHVGSTAVPGALTKGDLDLMVRVPADRFEKAADALRSVYSIHQPENWTATYASFLDPEAADPPVGVQLVVTESDDEALFEPFIAALREDPALLADYNALKRRLDGSDYETYTAAKSEFIERAMSKRAPGGHTRNQPRRP